MKISTSLFTSSNTPNVYAKKLDELKPDFIHIDYFQDKKKPVPICKLNKNLAKTPFDVHLIYKKFSKHSAKYFNNTTTDILCLQYENLLNKQDILNLKYFKKQKGIAFSISTPLKEVEKYFNAVNFIMIMCSSPGISGGKFDKRNLTRIKEIKKLYPNKVLHVDGGLNLNLLKTIRNYKPNLCILGSFFGSTPQKERIKNMLLIKKLLSKKGR